MEPGLSNTREYLVPLITDEEGRTTGVHLYHRPETGKVLWLFTSHERGDEFMSALMSEPGEEDKAFMEVIEQAWGRLVSEDVNFGGHFSAKTVPQMARDLEGWKVDRLIVDPGFPGWQQRVYESPYKSLPEYVDSAMMAEYVDSALNHASFEELEDGTLYAEIPGFKGVWASGEDVPEVREELREVLQDWIEFRTRRDLELPTVIEEKALA